VPTSATETETDPIRARILDATGVALAHYGPRKLSLTDIAASAGVSRPTLYRRFTGKEELLLALAAHEKQRFQAELAVALHGLDGASRLDGALRFVVEFQHDYRLRDLVAIEPTFMLDQLERALRTMTAPLVTLFEALPPTSGDVTPSTSGDVTPSDLADLVVRTALSHFLIRGDDDQLLRELRHIAGTGS
jgi:AcrR family transcriptional regulator